MNVGVVAASLSLRGGGVYEVVRRSALEFHARGLAHVSVFGLADAYVERDQKGWAPVAVNAFRKKGYKPFGYAPGLLPALCAAAPDILHNHGLWMYPSVATMRWSKLMRRPYVISTHGMLDPWAVGHASVKKKLAGLLYERRHLANAQCLHALCSSEADAIRRYGLSNPVCVIPCGVDVPSPDRPGAAREEQVLLFLGRLHPKKGLANLLAAWRRVLRSGGRLHSRWKLVIAGWDERGHEAELVRLSESLGLTSINFVGPKFGNEKEALLRSAGAFILPSFSEGLPVSVLEAWAYGLPVVMTPECNLPQGITAGAAISVNATAQSIEQGLLDMMGMSDAERSVMGMRGRQLVEKQFSWASYAEQMHAVYAWMAGGGARPACIGLA